MYKNFIQTADGGYLLKKQGMISTFIIGGLFAGLSLMLFYLNFKSGQANLLIYGLMMAIFSLFIFWKSTKQFIIYPKQNIFKYSKGLGIGFQEFRFDELDGATQENMKNMYGIKTGNSFKLGFEKNGKYKEIVLGQNVSAKKMRSINEEINQIMKG